MSLDKLAIIFIIIILPISVVLSSYTTAQVDTLKVQSLYDTKLYNATYDAIKAYQLNSFNEDTSDLANSKLRLVKASANAFFNSIANNFSMQGYTKDDLQGFVPALVFTMYDGYYIYSKYTNKLDFTYPTETTNPTYKDNQELYGIKPYIYYSCRYTKGTGTDSDFVITYSLDNYITIQGIIDGKSVNDSGYLIDTSKIKNIDTTNKTLEYDGYLMQGEKLVENIGNTPYTYHKVNGRKYYLDTNYNNTGNHRWFSLLNGKKIYTGQKFNEDIDYSAYYYYYDALTFTQRVTTTGTDRDGRTCYGLQNLTVLNCEEAKNDENFMKTDTSAKIFNVTNIEEPTSNFNSHRLAVIRYSIEKNLSIAIANYNTYYKAGVAGSNNFQMPELTETEWAKILNNISVISFMQGLPIGVKDYNGCAVVPNNKNSEVVTESSIYICEGNNGRTSTGTYYKPTSKSLNGTGTYTGAFNIDFERRYYFDEDGTDVIGDYYYPKFYMADYNSIVTSAKVDGIPNDNIYEYFRNNKPTKNRIATAYYTALGRERFGTYKVNKNADQVLSLYLVP